MRNIAVIGCGAWGSRHVRVLKELGVLKWAYDENSIRTAGEPERSDSIDQILGDTLVQGVIIATPPDTHAVLALHCLDAGKYILIEKPMCGTIEEAEMLCELPESHQIMVGHLMMYHDGFRKVREVVGSGRLGRIEYAYSNRLQPGKVRDSETSLWQLAPHDVSMLHALLGSPKTVVASGTPGAITTLMAFKGDAWGHVFVSWLHPTKIRMLGVIGSEQSLLFQDTGSQWCVNLYNKGAQQVDSWSGCSDALINEDTAFLNFCLNGRTDVGAKRGLDVVRILDAAHRSMMAGGERICL